MGVHTVRLPGPIQLAPWFDADANGGTDSHAHCKRNSVWPDFIMESVDSNVGIARTRNIYIKISKSQKRWTYRPLWQHTVHLRVFHDQQDSQWRERASRIAFWMPGSMGTPVFRQKELALSSIQRRV